jgi:probable non-F420 flavinoid oxidoreductase
VNLDTPPQAGGTPTGWRPTRSPTEFGYHASHEQLPPGELLALVRDAEKAGFEAVLSSDHFAPWSRKQGCSGNAYTWLGAAVTSTQCQFGVVSAPGYRQHPAVLAQQIATVADLAPGRFTAALGSGQALNEHITGEPWPDKGARNARLAECADVIGRLLTGEQVDADGAVRVHKARLWEVPAVPVPLFGAALSPGSAASVGAWADGLITVAAPRKRLSEVIGAFRDVAGKAAPVHVQAHVSWAARDDLAREQAVQHWPVNALPPEVTEELQLVEEFDERYADLTADALEDSVVMSADPVRHADALAEIADQGVERIYIHDVTADTERFVLDYADQVLTRLR